MPNAFAYISAIALFHVATSQCSAADNAPDPAVIQLNTGVFYVPGFAKPNMMLDAAPQAGVATVQVGWTSLPKQTKLENWTLSCRDARLVAYTDVSHVGVDLKQEVLNVINNCANSTIQQITLQKVIADPSGTLKDFAGKFAQCTLDAGVAQAKAIGLHLETEHGDWGKC